MERVTDTVALSAGKAVDTKQESIYSYINSELWGTIVAALQLENRPKGFSSISWIARKLDEPIELVEKAIEGLIELGFIKFVGTDFVVPSRKERGDFNILEYLPRKALIDACRNQSVEIVAQFNEDCARMGNYAQIASNEKAVQNLRFKVKKALEEFEEESYNSKKDGIYTYTCVLSQIMSGGDVDA